MVHKKILAKIDQHFDDLKVREPELYDMEEKHLAKDELRLGNEVASAPPGIQRLEKRP